MIPIDIHLNLWAALVAVLAAGVLLAVVVRFLEDRWTKPYVRTVPLHADRVGRSEPAAADEREAA